MKNDLNRTAPATRLWRLRSLLAGLCICSGAAVSAPPVDLNGTWKLDVSASYLGEEHPFPDYALTRILRMDGSVLHQTEHAIHDNIVNIPLAESTVTTDFTVDGKEHVLKSPNPFPGGPAVERRFVCDWQGNTLVITESNVSTDEAYYSQWTYFLSADGSQLIEMAVAKNRFGDASQRLVFDRQSKEE
jgi:hypothetical protein